MSATVQHPSWWREALDGAAPSGCMVCPGRPQFLDEDARLSVGFGFVEVSKDHDGVWSGDDWDVSIDRFEVMAAADPDHDWLVHFEAPLYSATFQRHGAGSCVLIERGKGFA